MEQVDSLMKQIRLLEIDTELNKFVDKNKF